MGLKRVVKLAELLVAQQSKVKEMEDALKLEKEELRRLEQEDLPALMDEIGLQEIRLSDGSLIKIQADVQASIKPENRDRAHKWLVDNGFGGLLKTGVTVSFGRGDREQAVLAAKELLGKYEDVNIKEDVHSSTLRAFVKERLELGGELPTDLFNIHPFNKAVIRKR